MTNVPLNRSDYIRLLGLFSLSLKLKQSSLSLTDNIITTVPPKLRLLVLTYLSIII